MRNTYACISHMLVHRKTRITTVEGSHEGDDQLVFDVRVVQHVHLALRGKRCFVKKGRGKINAKDGGRENKRRKGLHTKKVVGHNFACFDQTNHFEIFTREVLQTVERDVLLVRGSIPDHIRTSHYCSPRIFITTRFI